MLVSGLALWQLPSMTVHMQRAAERLKEGLKEGSIADLLHRPVVLVNYAMVAFAMCSMFVLIPNISAYIQGNLGFPRADMGLLYLVGGLPTLFIMRPIGLLTDKFGAFKVGTIGTLLQVVVVYWGFVSPPAGISVMLLFALFMSATSIRNVPFNTLATQVPRPFERARFMSMQSAVQHLSAAFGAFLSSEILGETADHVLVGIPTLGWISIALAATMPFTLFYIQKVVKKSSS